MKHLSVLAMWASISTMACMAAAQAAGNYKLVWSDEFDRNGTPNPENWTYEHGFVRNHELQWYQPQNAFCTNGLLIIEGRREHRKNPNYQKHSRDWRRNRRNIEYTSACLTTKGLHSWKYGRFEVRAKIKTKNGLWPAIWFLGTKGRWPDNGEIDLMEYYKGKILANACWGSKHVSKPVWDTVKKPVASFNDPNFDNKFHIWRMDWNKKEIRLYIDNIQLNTIDLATAVNATGKWGPKQPFQQPQYLLLNLAIGGGSGGDPSHTHFPTRYEIDYVRVYQKENPASSE